MTNNFLPRLGTDKKMYTFTTSINIVLKIPTHEIKENKNDKYKKTIQRCLIEFDIFVPGKKL